MISCKRATELISKGADTPLAFREKIALKLHLSVCDVCSYFERSVATLRAAMRRVRAGDADPGGDEQVMPDAAKRRIVDRLKRDQ